MDANHRPTAYRLTIRRRVSDIDEWRQTIEQRIPRLRDAGVNGYSLSRVVDDHSETELVLEFGDRDQAEAMAGRLDLPEEPRERAAGRRDGDRLNVAGRGAGARPPRLDD